MYRKKLGKYPLPFPGHSVEIKGYSIYKRAVPFLIHEITACNSNLFIPDPDSPEQLLSLLGNAGLEITEKNYLSGRNVTKKLIFPPRFPPSQPENLGFLTLIEVKTGTFPSEHLPPTLTFPPQFLPLPERRKGSKFEPWPG